jgi:hypothetical protein
MLFLASAVTLYVEPQPHPLSAGQSEVDVAQDLTSMFHLDACSQSLRGVRTCPSFSAQVASVRKAEKAF